MSSVISIHHVSKTFPGVKALNDVSFEINHGEIHAFIGENGAGKSTLIKILTGVYQADEGAKIVVDGKEAAIHSPFDASSLGISVIYQDFSLFPNLTVAENILLGYEVANKVKKVNWKTLKEKADKVLKELEINIDSGSIVENLSVGKQQLVAIARAIAYDAKLLIMDEPTSTLSNAEVQHLFKIMKKLKGQGVSILFVSHKLDELLYISDRFTVLRDGNYVGTFQREGLTEEQLIHSMVGRKVNFEKRKSVKNSDVVLKIHDLCKKGNFADISFELYKGEILGITGLVGSGRSEVLKAIFGLNKPDSGEIVLNGKKIKIRSTYDAQKFGFAFIPENRLTEGISMDSTVKENISITILNKLKGRLHVVDTKREVAIAKTYANRLDVRPCNIDMIAQNLSGGNQQKVVLAKWLADEPDIILVDEPTNGIDIGAKTEIHKLLIELAGQGKSILVVSSEMLEIMALCDRTLVMSKGRITGEFKTNDMVQEDLLKAALC